MKNMIAYCGLDCEKCDAYIATINDDEELRIKVAKLWGEMNNAPITPEMINCMGCRVEGVKTPFCDSMCEIRKCALKKSYATCGNCSDINSCTMLKYVFDNSEDAKTNLTSNE